jgi:hypothetical protein
MIKKYTFIACCFLLGLTLAAQETEEESATAVRRSGRSTAAIRLELNGTIGVASRDITTYRMQELRNASFLSNEMKQRFLEDVRGKLNLGYAFGWDIGLYFDFRKRGHKLSDAYGLSIFHRGYLGLSSPKSTVQLALLGNKPFAGQTLTMDDTRYESWLYTGVRYQFNVSIQEQPVQFGFAVVFGHEHSRYSFSEFSLYTEPDGAYLDVNANYTLEDYNTAFLYGVAGMGAAADVTYKMEAGKSAFTFQVQDIGFAYFTRGARAEADSNFRFSGIEVSNIFDIKDSLIDAQRNALENELWYENAGKRLAMLPFRARAEYIYQMGNRGFTRAFGRLDYLKLPGYLPRPAAAVEYSLSEAHRLQLELAYGGFNATTVGLRYEAFLGKQWYVYAVADNVPGLLFQRQAMGSFVQAGVHFWIL